MDLPLIAWCLDGRDVAGIRFFEHVNLALEYLDAAVESAGIAGRVERGSLKIGIFSSLASGFLPELLRCYSARHPEIEVNIVEGSPRGIDLAAHELLPGLIDRVLAATPRGAQWSAGGSASRSSGRASSGDFQSKPCWALPLNERSRMSPG
jgi:DNA-binding transcriptional LysR family regulator